MKKLKILINDFGGYPFPIELSRQLAKNGYSMLHCYVSNINTPHGNMQKKATDSDNLTIRPIILDSEFKKYSFLGRFKGELEFSKKLNNVIEIFSPDILLSGNTPLIAQSLIQNKCIDLKIKFIYWCQDIHSIAINEYLKKKFSFIGSILAKYFHYKEIALLNKSDKIITISEDFNTILNSWGINQDKITTIHNWAPVEDIELSNKENAWSIKNDLQSKFVTLYSGTLGLKHNPEIIIQAAKDLIHDQDFVFLVISEGIGATYLQKEKAANNLTNLHILPFQDYPNLPLILSSADILLSILESDAALYSVPSKVLTYLCIGRPIILSLKYENLAARIIKENNTGYVLSSANTVDLTNKIKFLKSKPSLAKKLGENGRKYAESNFRISHISDLFANIFEKMS
jgi:colanic acid biosynthesis glycosyl transferase WcaI